MNIKYLLVHCVLLFSLIACEGNNTADNIIKDMNVFLNKWEGKVKNGSLNGEDNVKIIQEFYYLQAKYQEVKIDEILITKEQRDMIYELADRVSQISIEIIPNQDKPFF